MDRRKRMERYSAKRQRAEYHLAELQRSIGGYVNTDSHRVFVDLNLEEVSWVLWQFKPPFGVG